MGRRKRAPSRIASQLKALQNVGTTTAEIREERKARSAAARVERQELRIKQRENKIREAALHSVDIRKIRPSKRPNVTVTQTAPDTSPPARGFFDDISRPSTPRPDDTVPETKAPEPTPERTQPQSKRDHFPIWVREGRQPSREEWQAHQRARMPYRADCSPTAFRNSGSELVPVESISDYSNGVDFHARPDGTRVHVFNDSPDAWRHGGPNWTKKL